jgi:hypothetical protein
MEETGQINNTIITCDRCNERHKGTIRIIVHKVKAQNVYYSSKLCHKCEEHKT